MARNLVAGAVSVVAAFFLLAWSTFGLFRHHGTPPVNPRVMQLYTNQSGALLLVTLNLHQDDESNTLAGDIFIQIYKTPDRAKLRWALMGQNGLYFSADMAESADSSADATRKTPDAHDPSVGYCGENSTVVDHSVLSGDGIDARLLGTAGVVKFNADTLHVPVHFVRNSKVSSIDSYQWFIGTFGQFRDRDRNGVRRPRLDCLHVRDVGNLTTYPSLFYVSLSPTSSNDRVLYSYPATSGGRQVSWDNVQGTYLEVSFDNSRAKEVNSTFVFIAGVLAGLATTILAPPVQRLLRLH